MMRHVPPDIHLRTSVRQAVLVDAASLTRADHASHLFADTLRQSIFLDLLGSLVGVNGVTISVLATNPLQAQQIASLIPPGIDVISPPTDLAEPTGRLSWAIAQHLERAFARVVVLAADIPALPPRTIATAFSSLASADAIVGTSTETGVYLLGLCNERGLAALERAGGAEGLDHLNVSTLASAPVEPRVTVRYVERRDRLVVDRLDAIREIIASAPGSSPRTATLLHLNSDSPSGVTGLPSVFGSGFDTEFARGFDR